MADSVCLMLKRCECVIFKGQANLQLSERRDFNGSSGKCSRKCRTRAVAPCHHGHSTAPSSKLVVEVALIPHPSGFGLCYLLPVAGRLLLTVKLTVQIYTYMYVYMYDTCTVHVGKLNLLYHKQPATEPLSNG